MKHRLFAMGCALAAAGCSILGKPATANFEFVLLTAVPPVAPGAGPAMPKSATVDLDHVTVAAYLNRVEVVTRDGDNLIIFSDKERWGEPLASAIPRVLSADLGRALDADGIAVTQGSAGSDLALSVTIDRFERRDDGQVEIVARWLLESHDARRTGETRALQPLPDPTPTATATALSQALGAVSTDVADAVRQLRPHHALPTR